MFGGCVVGFAEGFGGERVWGGGSKGCVGLFGGEVEGEEFFPCVGAKCGDEGGIVGLG